MVRISLLPILLALVALGIGFAVGRSTASPRVSKPAPCPSVAPAVTTKTVIEGTSCEERLAFATKLWEAERVARLGTPVGFPAGLDPAFRPDGFESAVRDVLEECPDVNLTLDHVDCSEFPCFAWFAQPEGSGNQGERGITSCPGWVERFGRGATSNANDTLVSDDKGVLAYAMIGPHPREMDWDENLSKRFDARLEDGRDRLMDRWGAREATPLETLDADLAFWRKRADEGFEGAAPFIEDLEGRRQRLLEKGE